MRSLASRLDLEALLAEVSKITFFRDGAGVDMAHPYDSGFPAWLARTHLVQTAITEIEGLVGGKATHLMLNRLNAGDHVEPHTDMDTGERWHLVLTTNPDSYWYDENDGELHMEAGLWWGPVPYQSTHAVWNNGDSDRIHLVVDIRRTEGG